MGFTKYATGTVIDEPAPDDTGGEPRTAAVAAQASDCCCGRTECGCRCEADAGARVPEQP